MHMMNFKKQRGASFVFWILFVALIGFIVTLGIKLFPVYYKGFATEKIIEDLAIEMQGKNPNKKQLWDLIQRRLDVNSIIGVKKENFVYEKQKKSLEFGVDYEVRLPLVANMDAVVMFNHRQTINIK